MNLTRGATIGTSSCAPSAAEFFCLPANGAVGLVTLIEV
jgi:hypothetical protein